MWKAEKPKIFALIPPASSNKSCRIIRRAPDFGGNNLIKGHQVKPVPRLCRESPLDSDENLCYPARKGRRQKDNRPPAVRISATPIDSASAGFQAVVFYKIVMGSGSHGDFVGNTTSARCQGGPWNKCGTVWKLKRRIIRHALRKGIRAKIKEK